MFNTVTWIICLWYFTNVLYGGRHGTTSADNMADTVCERVCVDRTHEVFVLFFFFGKRPLNKVLCGAVRPRLDPDSPSPPNPKFPNTPPPATSASIIAIAGRRVHPRHRLPLRIQPHHIYLELDPARSPPLSSWGASQRMPYGIAGEVLCFDSRRPHQVGVLQVCQTWRKSLAMCFV